MQPAAAGQSPGLTGGFWVYWAGQTVSSLGSSVTTVVLPLLVFQLTGSPLNLAFTVVAAVLPYALFGLIVGAWVDRVNRRRLMIGADLARALAVASIPVAARLGLLSVWWIYAVAFVSSTLSMAFDAANFAAIPSLVGSDELVRANGRIQASYSVARALGPFLAGLLFAVFALPPLLLIDAASFLVSAVSLGLVRASFNAPPASRPGGAGLRRDIVEGLRYVLSHPVLRSIILLLLFINFVLPTVSAQLVLFAKDVLAVSNAQVGFLYAAGSVGTVLCSFVAAWLGRRWSLGTLALMGLALEGGAVALVAFVALAHLYWIVLVLWAVGGGADALFTIATYSLAQRMVPNHLLGRVITFTRVLTWSTASIGVVLGGLAIERTGSPILVYGVIGALVCVVALGFRLTPVGHAERYLAVTPAPQPPRAAQEHPA